MKIEYKKEAPGMIRITSKIESILTPQRCIEEAEKILNRKNNGNLKYTDTPELCDNMLLAQEIDTQNEIHAVVFKLGSGDIIVNKNNIEKISDQLLAKKKSTVQQKGQHVNAIKDAMAETWGDIGK